MIQGYAVGDDLTVRATITTPQSITAATFSVTGDPIAEKSMTTADSPGTGQIEADGADGTAVVRVDLTAANTTALGTTDYLFRLRITLADGKINTPVWGHIQFVATE